MDRREYMEPCHSATRHGAERTGVERLPWTPLLQNILPTQY